MKPPFFIIGCVRSGTSLLRYLLGLHPNLGSPNETHFFSHGHPFGTLGNRHIAFESKNMIAHRELDGITREEFEDIYFQSNNRRELIDRYCKLYLEKIGKPKGRWFDKSPQHVYGMLLIGGLFPNSKFIHIARNPLNVVASLKIGKDIHVPELQGAINFWMESMFLIEQYSKGYPNRILEVRYEDLLRYPKKVLTLILEFVGEIESEIDFKEELLKKESNKYLEILSEEEITVIRKECKVFMEKYGFE